MPKRSKSNGGYLSLDSETTGLDFHHGARPFLVTTCNEDHQVVWWEWGVDPLTRKVQASRDDLVEIQEAIDQAEWLVLQNPKFDVTGLDLLFQDYRMKLRWPWEKVYCTLMAGHLLASNQPHDLTSMALVYLGVDTQPLEDAMEEAVKDAKKWASVYRRWWKLAKEGQDGMPSAKSSDRGDPVWKYDCWLPKAVAIEENYSKDHPWRTVTSKYANGDSGSTLPLFLSQKKLIEERGLWKIYQSRMRLLPSIRSMEQWGVTMSRGRTMEYQEQLSKTSARLHRECVELADGEIEQLPVNGVSNALKHVIFEKFKLQSSKKTKKGNVSMDKFVLDDWIATLPEGKPLQFVKNLRGYRRRQTSLGYIKAYRKYWLPVPKTKNTMILYPSANPTATHTLRFNSENPNSQQVCFDGETEVLTKQGWVRADEITSGMEILQYWKETKRLDWAFPTIHSPEYRGKMLHIRTGLYIDMMLTPRHRCLVQNRKTGDWKDLPAEEFSSDWKHFNAGTYTGGKVSLSEEMVTWLCAVQADGSYVVTRGRQYGISFGLRKRRKIARLVECLKKLGASYRVSLRSGSTWIYLGSNTPLVQKTKRIMPKKQFGPWLLDCDRTTLDRFAEEVFLWDGDFTRRGSYGSKVKENADWVQTLWALSGSRAYSTTRHPNETWLKSPHYVVSLSRGRDASLTTNYTVRESIWRGKVYCVSVPSSYVLIRRNGRISVTGNSKQGIAEMTSTGEEVKRSARYMFGPAPGREWWSLDAKNLELRIPAYEAGEQAMIDLFEHPELEPYFGSYHLLIFDILHPDLFAKHGKAVKDVYADTWYQWTKNGNFAVQYGAQESSGTADRAYHVPGAQARIQSHLRQIRKLSDYWVNHARKTGYVETMPDSSVDPEHGYPLWCIGLKYGSHISPTIPLSYHVQGTAMWWTCRAMERCHDYLSSLDGYHITLQVHDEIVFDFPRQYQEVNGKPVYGNLKIIDKVTELMEQGGKDLGVPIAVSRSYHSHNWGEGVSVANAS